MADPEGNQDPATPDRQRFWDGAAWTGPIAPRTPEAESPGHATPGRPKPNRKVRPSGYYEKPKDPAISVVASVFVPGLGSMLNGDTGTGIAILIGYFVSFVLTFFFIGIIGLIGFWIWGVIDAYRGAQRWNLEHGIDS